MKQFFNDWRRWNLSTAWWNLQFTAGYWIGGFTSAKRRDA